MLWWSDHWTLSAPLARLDQVVHHPIQFCVGTEPTMRPNRPMCNSGGPEERRYQALRGCKSCLSVCLSVCNENLPNLAFDAHFVSISIDFVFLCFIKQAFCFDFNRFRFPLFHKASTLFRFRSPCFQAIATLPYATASHCHPRRLPHMACYACMYILDKPE